MSMNVGNNLAAQSVKEQQLLRNSAKAGTASAAAASGTVSTKAKSEAPSEKFEMSSKLLREQEIAKDVNNVDNDEASQQIAGQTSAKKKESKKETGEAQVGDHLQTQRAEGRVVEDADDVYDIGDEELEQVGRLDNEAKQLNADMPEATKAAATNMVTAEIEKKGIEDVAELKSVPEIDAKAGELELDPVPMLAEPLMEPPTPKGDDYKPMQLEDTFSEAVQLEAARDQQRRGQGDQTANVA